MKTHFAYETEPFEAYTDFEMEFEIDRSSRDYIKWVQSSLNKIIATRLVVDGISGSKTRAAVRTFQRKKGLTADGVVGPITEGALVAAGAAQPPGSASGVPSPGTPGTGSPSSAIDTFLPYSGTGYESKYSSSDSRFNQYGRSQAILALQWIARAWQRAHPNGPKLYIGPISKKGGGTLCYPDGMCHAEHKDGLDIDIRPVRKDQSKGGLKFTDSSYSRQLTQELVDLAWSNRCVPVEKILFNDSAIKGVQYSSGHDDHLHLSFKTPSGSVPAECRSTGSGYGGELSEEMEEEWEEFLGDFWSSLTKPRIEDRTALTPKDRRKGVRDIKKVYALVLHQMAFSRGNEAKKYDTVTAHFAILPDGKITQLHPETALLWASNGFNTGSVAVEFAGNFPNTKGKCWEPTKFGCHKVTPEQIEAGRYLVEYLIKKIGLTHILAHRQSSDTRENDPGPDIWYGVGQWGVEKHGLKDGGPGFKVGSGNPIPDEWRKWGSIKKDPEITWEMSDEFEEGESYDEFADEEAEFSLSALPASVINALRSGMESVALKLAIANGHRDENDLTNIIFFSRHKERGEQKLSKGEPNFDRLANEWTEIRDRLVRPALRGSGGTTSAPSKSGASKPVETSCTPVNPRGKNEETLMKILLPFVQKYRGDIPVDFLLGWIAVESAGYIEAITAQCERGYFQLHPEEARGVGADEPQRLSTDPEYSVKMGIEMVKQKMARAEQLGFARGTDLNRHFAKLLHWLPAYVPIMVNLWNASKSSPRTWKGFSDFIASNRDDVVKTMAKYYPKNNLLKILTTNPGASNADPVHGIMGVDKVFAQGPFWEARLRKAGALKEMEMFEEADLDWF